MKKIFLYSIVALIGVLSVCSCVQPLEPGPNSVSGKHQLTLSVSCTTPGTKADDTYPAGVDTLNENRIDHIDWFIFRDTTSGTAWKSDRVSFTNKTDGTTEFAVLSQDMDTYMTDYSDGVGYVFTIANYPGTEGHALFEGKTFAQIRQMGFVTSELDNMVGKRFSALPNFVMTSGAEKFTLTETAPTATVHAKLSRQISKISLNISVVPYIDEMKAYVTGLDTTRLEYIQTWYPDVAGIRAYMMYADKASTLTPVTVETETSNIPIYTDATEINFFSYYSRGYVASVEKHTDNSATVTGTPFYSYPMRWANSDAHAPFIKIILKWKSVVEPTEEIQESVYNHTIGGQTNVQSFKVTSHSFPTNMSDAENFYYKITIPTDESAPNRLRSNVWTKINLDVAILGGIEDESSVEVAGRYYVVDWSNPGIVGGGDLTSGKYLSLESARDTFYMYGTDSLEIPVKSSHQLAATITKREVLVNQTWTTTASKPTNLSTRGSISYAEDGHSYVEFIDELNREIGANLDCYPMRFTLQIQHAAGSGGLSTTQTVVVYQYPSIFIDQRVGGNVFVDGYYGYINGSSHGTGQTGSSDGDTYVSTPYGNLKSNALPSGDIRGNLTILTISAFGDKSKSYTVSVDGQNQTRQYLIVDPRQDTTLTPLTAYYNGANTTNWGDNAGKIKIGDKINPNFIAPKLIVASRWGRQVEGSTSYENSIKRCATYQEAGYPAGRWRLPTEAEVYFMMQLQRNGFIGGLFNTSTNVNNTIANGYWINYNAQVRSNQTSSLTSRCVYDAWYWGDDPVEGAQTVYTIGVE